MLANHDQNKCLSCFRLAQSVCVNVKLESSGCRSISDFRLGSIDRRIGLIDRISGRMLFSVDFQLSPSSFKTFRFLYFCQVYKANLSHVLQVAHIVVCVNLLWDLWGAFFYASLGLSRGDSFKNLMIIQLLH